METTKYKVVNGTSYHIETPEDVITFLELARQNRKRLKVYYGDVKTGKDWAEENDTIGYIGRSTKYIDDFDGFDYNHATKLQ